MVFSSITFLFKFLPIALGLYFIVPSKFKNGCLFLISLIFYSWGEIKFFPILILSTVVDYFLSHLIQYFDSKKSLRKLCLLLSLTFNLGMLFFFKYADFFIENINSSLGFDFPLLNLTLPLGISFYTFQTLSYTIDVYRREIKPEKNIITFGTYISMFPQLIAGPIVKYSQIEKQLHSPNTRIDLNRIDEGIKLFVIGLAKKVLIANNIGALWTEVTQLGYSEISTGLAWLAVIAYTLQIYFDFSGYSLMAIGLGKMLGFDFPQNFNFPYISQSITEFWRRWHISLSSWFKEYVYIPLGGNRDGAHSLNVLGVSWRGYRQIFNLLVVWLLTGFWHGSEWNFILWGLYYFTFLALEKLFLSKIIRNKLLSHIYTMVVVMVGWAIFAISDFEQLVTFLKVMFTPTDGISALYFIRNYGFVILLGAILSTQIPIFLYKKISKYKVFEIIAIILLFLASVAYLVDATYNPFLYFRF